MKKKLEIILSIIALFTITLVILRFCGLDIHIHIYIEGICSCGKIKNIRDYVLTEQIRISPSAKGDKAAINFEDIVSRFKGNTEATIYEMTYSKEKDFFIVGYNEWVYDTPKYASDDSYVVYYNELEWYKINNIEEIQNKVEGKKPIITYLFKYATITKDLMEDKNLDIKVTIKFLFEAGRNRDSQYKSLEKEFRDSLLYYDSNSYIKDTILKTNNVNLRSIYFDENMECYSHIPYVVIDNTRYLKIHAKNFYPQNIQNYPEYVYKITVNSSYTSIYEYCINEFIHLKEYDTVHYDNYGEFNYIRQYYGLEERNLISFFKHIKEE